MVACTEQAKAPQPLAAGGSSSSSPRSLPLPAVSSIVATWPILPERRLVSLDSARPVPGRPFSARLFHYAAAKGNWPYGTGISLWRDGASRPAWVYFHDGDFPPHTLVWQDLTGDRIPDLFFLAGEEDEFASTALEWRESGEAGGDPLLVPIYSDSDSYAMLADLDGDGLPELIDSGNAKDDEADGCESLVFPPEVAERAQEEYARIAGQYAEVNFNSGTANHAVWTLHLLQPVRIISLKGGLRTEVTRRFGTHLGIRIKILETVRQAASPECRRTLDALVGYLKSEMGNSR